MRAQEEDIRLLEEDLLEYWSNGVICSSEFVNTPFILSFGYGHLGGCVRLRSSSRVLCLLILLVFEKLAMVG